MYCITRNSFFYVCIVRIATSLCIVFEYDYDCCVVGKVFHVQHSHASDQCVCEFDFNGHSKI